MVSTEASQALVASARVELGVMVTRSLSPQTLTCGPTAPSLGDDHDKSRMIIILANISLHCTAEKILLSKVCDDPWLILSESCLPVFRHYE